MSLYEELKDIKTIVAELGEDNSTVIAALLIAGALRDIAQALSYSIDHGNQEIADALITLAEAIRHKELLK